MFLFFSGIIDMASTSWIVKEDKDEKGSCHQSHLAGSFYLSEEAKVGPKL